MTPFKRFICPQMLLAILLFSCHKKDIVGQQGPAGPQGSAGSSSSLKGDIQGRISLYDTAGQLLPADSGATVSLENTSPLLEAITAVDGSFTIPSVHSGTYDISVQKQGYGTMRYLNFPHSGTTQSSQTGLLLLTQQMPSPQYDIKQLRVDSGYSGGSNYLLFTVILAHPQKLHNPKVLIYFNDSTGVSNTNSKYVFWSNFFQQNDTTLLYSPFDFPLSDLSDKLSKANYLYLAAAIDNPINIFYTNEHGIQIYPAAGKQSPEVIVNNVLHKY